MFGMQVIIKNNKNIHIYHKWGIIYTLYDVLFDIMFNLILN